MGNIRGLFLGAVLVVSVQAAPAGLFIRTDYRGTFFFLPSDKVVYVEKCTENESAPRTVEECFGVTSWPNSQTPMVSAQALKDRVAAAKKADKTLSTQIADHEALIKVRENVITEKDKSFKELSDSIARATENIAFVESRLKDTSLTKESLDELAKSRQRYIRLKESFEQARLDVVSAKLTQEQFIGRLKDSITQIRAKADAEKLFNEYLDKEENLLFTGTTFRSLSSAESFAQNILPLAFSEVKLYWEGSETIRNYRHPELKYRLALKKLVVSGAVPAGQLEISFRKLFWSKDLPALKIKIDQDFIEKGAALSGEDIPSDYRQEDGRVQLTIRNGKQDIIPSYIAVGRQVIQVSQLANSEQFSTIPNAQLEGAVRIKSVGKDDTADLSLPPRTRQLDLVTATHSAGRVVEGQNYINGMIGRKDCLESVRIVAYVSDSRYSPLLRALNGEKLKFRNLEGTLTLSSVDASCHYSGLVKRDDPYAFLRRLTWNGLMFEREWPTEP